MTIGQATFSDIGNAVNDIFQGQATQEADNLKAVGDQVEAQNYEQAAALAEQNEAYTVQSTALQEAAAQRQLALSEGSTQAQVAGAGFSNGGSAGDILRASAQQGAIQQQVINEQGAITEAGYQEQAQSYNNLAAYAEYSGQQEQQFGQQAQRNGVIGAVLNGVGAAFSLLPTNIPGMGGS